MRLNDWLLAMLWCFTIIVLFIFMIKPVDAKPLDSFIRGKCIEVDYDKDVLRCATRKHFCIVRYKADKQISFACRRSQSELNEAVNNVVD